MIDTVDSLRLELSNLIINPQCADDVNKKWIIKQVCSTRYKTQCNMQSDKNFCLISQLGVQNKIREEGNSITQLAIALLASSVVNLQCRETARQRARTEHPLSLLKGGRIMSDYGTIMVSEHRNVAEARVHRGGSAVCQSGNMGGIKRPHTDSTRQRKTPTSARTPPFTSLLLCRGATVPVRSITTAESILRRLCGQK